MGRLSNLRVVDPVLTNIALGYTNDQFVGDWLMPIVEVDKERNKLPKFGKEAFKLYNTERALRAASNRINPEGIDQMDLATDEHDIEYPIDYREDEEASFPLEAWAVNVTQEVIRLRLEKKIADLAQNAANYGVGNKIALSGTSQFSHASSDPEGVVDDGKAAIRGKIGREPNTMIFGYQAWRTTKRNKALKATLSDSRSRLVNLADVREIFEIPNVVVGRGVYALDDGTFFDLWGDNIVLAYVPPKNEGQGLGRNVGAPAFGYTPRRKGNPQIDVRNPDGKVELVRATDNFRPYIVGADAGYLISDVTL